MGFLRVIFFSFLFVACSFSTPKNSLPNVQQPAQKTGENLGEIALLDSTKVNLDSLNNPYLVLIFASDVCATCAEEVEYWKQIFKTSLPKNIDFYHVMIGGILEDSIDWANYHEVNWPIAIAPGDELFKKYCPEIRTPCTLIYDRHRAEVYQTYQVLKQQDIERKTGLWIF